MKSNFRVFGVALPLFLIMSLASHIPFTKGEGLNLEYTISIENPSSHILRVTLDIVNMDDEQLILARQTPYQTNPPIVSMTVKDALGNNVPYEVDTSVEEFESLIIDSAGITSLAIEYSVDLEYFGQDPQGGYSYWSLDASYGAVESHLVFFPPVIYAVASRCEVGDNLPSGWKMVSRLIDKGNYYEANIDDKVTLYATRPPYQFLIWGPVVFGDFDEYFKTIGGIEAEVAFYGNDDLQEDISKDLFTVMEYYTETIGPLNDPPNSSKPIKYLYVFLRETDRNVHCGDHIYGVTGADQRRLAVVGSASP